MGYLKITNKFWQSDVCTGFGNRIPHWALAYKISEHHDFKFTILLDSFQWPETTYVDFPQTESTFLDETLLLHKKYNDIMFYTTDIRLNNEDQKAVSKLTIPNLNSSKQLFVEVRTYVKDGSFSNTIRLYVFDLRAKKLLYYDSVKYKCDPRDEIMFMKTLYYGMNKLKNSIN